EGLAGDPAVLDRQVPAARLLALADDHLDAVVLHVQRLAPALDAVADHRHRLRGQDLAELFRWIVAALHHGFGHIPDLDLTNRCNSLAGLWKDNHSTRRHCRKGATDWPSTSPRPWLTYLSPRPCRYYC